MTTWAALELAPVPVYMAALVAFVERTRPGISQSFRPATAEQITALAAAHGGVDVLPGVYREFLAVMGESTGELELTWGSTSITDLLEELVHPDIVQPDPARFVKFGIGEYNIDCGKQEDDFFDLAQRTADLHDAAVFRAFGKDLMQGVARIERPFATFSDFLRTMVAEQTWFAGRNDTAVWLRQEGPAAAPRYLDVLERLGFVLTELGGSSHCVPMENPERDAVALLDRPAMQGRGTFLKLHARDPKQLRLLREIITDHLDAARAP